MMVDQGESVGKINNMGDFQGELLYEILSPDDIMGHEAEVYSLEIRKSDIR